MEIRSNLELHKKEDYCLVSINPRIYALDVVYSAAYVFLDRAYVLIDGEPEEEIIVELKPKGKEDLEKLGREFNNELLNYAQYKKQSELNAGIRQAILQRALLTNDLQEVSDSKGIAIPWEKKFGKKK